MDLENHQRSGALLGPALVTAAMAVQTMWLGFLLIEPPAQDTSRLTDFGRLFFVPEHDKWIYVGSIGIALGLLAMFLAVRNRRDSPNLQGRGRLDAWAILQPPLACVATALSTVIFVLARQSLRSGEGGEIGMVIALAGLWMATVVAGFGGWGPGLGKKPPISLRRPLARCATQPVTRRTGLHWLDLAVPVAIVALFYVARWRLASGELFLVDGLLHPDYYQMAPALQFRAGLALGTEISSMYGLGWPMVFAALFEWIDPSYGRLVQIGSIYTCIYLAGIYLFLRIWIGRPFLSAAGTGLVGFQLFGTGDQVLWLFLIGSALRFALDVWCMIALVLHWRRESRAWAVAAGAFAGLAVVFNTDTGLFLVVASAFYWLGLIWMTDARRKLIGDAAAFSLTALLAVVTSIAVASRGSFLQPAFWGGWLEAIFEFGRGYAQLPLATTPNGLTITLFALIVFLYVVQLGFTLSTLAYRTSTHFLIFNGFLAVYGLQVMLHFVGRSYDYTPAWRWVPLALILTGLLNRLIDGSRPPRRLGFRGARLAAAALLLLAVTGVALAAFRSGTLSKLAGWPNLAGQLVGENHPDGLCLMLQPRDICGLPVEAEGAAARFQQIASKMREVGESGDRVHVVDESGALFSVAADTVPWSRYARPFVSVHTKQKLDRLIRDLSRNPPDAIFTRQLREPTTYEGPGYFQLGLGPYPRSPFADTWSRLRSFVMQHYRLEATYPPFELWRLD